MSDKYKYEVGDLVELESGARLFVAQQYPDCDGTPLYCLTPKGDDFKVDKEGFANINWLNGYPENSLKFIKPRNEEVKYLWTGAEQGYRQNPKYFKWIYDVSQLLKINGADILNDVNWWGCYDDGMTPEESVKEYQTFFYGKMGVGKSESPFSKPMTTDDEVKVQ